MSEFDIIKKLPYSLEAEQAMLGALITDPEKITGTMFLKEQDFYLDQHKAIYSAMVEMFLTNKIIDPVTLINALVQLGSYTEGDAAKYIKLLVDISTVLSNVGEYAAIIRDKSLLRDIINASREISDNAFSELGEASESLDFAEQKIFDLAQNRYNVSFEHIRDLILRNYATLRTLKENPEAASGIKTGFENLDDFIVGLGEGHLIIIGGRPGMGKTSFAMNIAANVAKHSKKEVAVFSLEMTAEQLAARLLSAEAKIDNYCMRTGRLDSVQWSDLAQAASRLSETDILFDDTSGINVTSMKAKLRRLKNLGLVIVDYLQLMQSEKRSDNRVLEIAAITRGLKLMAKDLKVPVILCSQLARGTENRSDKMPQLSDLRDSGAIEQDADIVLFLYRSDYYSGDGEDRNKKSPEVKKPVRPGEQVMAQCSVAKNRYGRTGVINMGWYGKYFKYVSVEKKYEDYEE